METIHTRSTRSDSPPSLSIIIVSYNTRELLLNCLRSLRTATQTLSVESIVVDNGSTDGSINMCRESFPEVRIIENAENVGFGRANNQAIEASQGEFILLLNSDTIVVAGALQRLMASIQRSVNIGVLGCRVVSPDGSCQPSRLRYPSMATIVVERLLLYRLWAGFPQSVMPNSDTCELQQCDWTLGACMLIRRAALESAGLFDPSIWLYGEELDLCYRIKKSGWFIAVDPAASIVHFGGASWDKESYSATLLKMTGLLRFCNAHFSRTEYYASYVLAGIGAALRGLICATMAILIPNRRKWHVCELRSNILLLARLGRGTLL